MSTTATAERPKETTAQEPTQPKAQLPTIMQPRLPYHPALEERFGIDQAGWRALVEAVFPNARRPESVILALSYCKARRLDVFKKVVHIVPIWDKERQEMVDTVWPGIAELRTTAFRTGVYAGRDKSEFGPTRTEKVGKEELSFPEWCQATVYRLVSGQRMAFPGPQVYWKECYAQFKRDDPTPNSMWMKRPFGQIDKCAEAAALRAAFPEEIGGEYAAEEIGGETIDVEPSKTSPSAPPVGRVKLNGDKPPQESSSSPATDVAAPQSETLPESSDPADFNSRAKVQAGNGSRPHGKECAAEWARIEKMRGTWGDDVITQAQKEANYDDLEKCTPAQLSVVIERVLDATKGMPLPKKDEQKPAKETKPKREPEPVGAGAGKGGTEKFNF